MPPQSKIRGNRSFPVPFHGGTSKSSSSRAYRGISQKQPKTSAFNWHSSTPKGHVSISTSTTPPGRPNLQSKLQNLKSKISQNSPNALPPLPSRQANPPRRRAFRCERRRRQTHQHAPVQPRLRFQIPPRLHPLPHLERTPPRHRPRHRPVRCPH